MGVLAEMVERWWSGLLGRNDVPPTFEDCAGEPANDAAAYGVSVEPAAVLPGGWYWRAARVHHLAAHENRGRHHIFVDALGGTARDTARPAPQRATGARVLVHWGDEGQTLTILGPAGRHGAQFPLWRQQMCSVEMLGLPDEELPSDRVVGIHSGHPEEEAQGGFRPVAGNAMFRHSFSILFARVRAAPRPDPLPIGHYLLLGPAEQPDTHAALLLAQDYLVAFRPAFGFSPEEAAQAARVTILGDLQAVPRVVEARLAATGARVERIHGSPREIAASLSAHIAAGKP